MYEYFIIRRALRKAIPEEDFIRGTNRVATHEKASLANRCRCGVHVQTVRGRTMSGSVVIVFKDTTAV